MNTISRFAPLVVRGLLGFIFFVFGLNGFLQFIPQPPPPAAAGAFFGALAATGYMLPLIMSAQVVAGALLLANRFVPLALALLAPVIVNIVLFHVMLAPGGIGVALVVLALELAAAWMYRSAFASMLHARTAPSAPNARTVEAPASAA